MIRLLLIVAATPFVVSALALAVAVRRYFTHAHWIDPDLSAYLAVPSCGCGAILFDARAETWVTIPDSPAGAR